MKHVGISLIAILVVCAGMIGCATESGKTSESMGSVVAEGENSVRDAIQGVEEEPIEDDAGEAGSITVDDIVASEGIWRLMPDGQTVTTLDTLTTLAYKNWGEEMVFIGGEAETIDRTQGEKLIYVGEATPSVYPVVETGYCQRGTEIVIHAYDYEEIDGVPTSEFSPEDEEQFYAERGAKFREHSGGTLEPEGWDRSLTLLQSSVPLVLSAGWYEGTEWHDGALNLDAPFYVTGYGKDEEGNYPTVGEVVQTKSGYFEIDLSALEPGLYVVQNDDEDDYAIPFELI